eukprot:CAMPEP_0114554022 /NCGR_PEP_ID=MMETSP0114-20121206/7984_1 /TAXON_ID=31324 /ORGANISM="Goniomonas sp, Strain m" /LENGTH=162 /DNA_ID=CAMNT_0001739033 /DNA_START=17 /DNA_END=505 /DNA_ORIENTATION=-
MFLRRLAPRVLRAAESAAEAAPSGAIPSKLTLNLMCPHEPILTRAAVDMVIVPGSDGIFGVLAGHVPTVSELRPGVLSVHEGDKKTNYFVSSGFAVVNPDSTADICALEAVPVDDLDKDIIKKHLADFTRQLGAAQTDAEKATAQIAVDCFTAMESATGASA